MQFSGVTVGYIAFSVVHVFAFALGLAVCGLYGQDISRAHHEHKYSDSKWGYAVAVGALSAFTCVLWFIPAFLRIAGLFAVAWEAVLTILWIAVFGVFGSMYIKEHADGDSGIMRMKNAVWVDLANMLLWFLLTLGTAAYWWKHRDTRSRFTGRAKV